MNSMSSADAGTGFTPTYRIQVYHPDTRSILTLPLQVLLERIERALKVEVDPRWLPTLVAMADGLFMQPTSVGHHVASIARVVQLDAGRAVRQVPKVIEALTDHRIVERATIEELYHNNRLSELNHPRVWELNSWWEQLYGAIPTRSHLDWDDEEDLDIWEEGNAGLLVGKTSLPAGLEPERDEIRTLLEKKVLSQYEDLFRLRLSWHR